MSKSRIWLVVAAIVVVAVVLIFKKNGDSGDQINVALFQAPASEALIKLIPEFEKETGIKVNYEILPYADLKTKIEQQFMVGGGNFDIIMADCIWIPSFAEKGYLAEFPQSVIDDNREAFDGLLPALDDYLGKYPKDGKRYGVPFMSNTHMLAFDPDAIKPALEELGLALPGNTKETAWSWEDYLKVAEEVTRQLRAAGKDDVYATSLQARAGAWLIYEWYSVLFGHVDDPEARKTGLPRFGEDAAAAMDFYSKMYALAPKAALTWGHEEETDAVVSGKCFMDATSNVELAAAVVSGNSKIQFAYPPIGKSGSASPDMGGYGLLLTKNSDNPEFAAKFLAWVVSDNVHRRVVLDGGSPIRVSETKDEEILKTYPFYRFYPDLIAFSVYRARIPKWPQLQDILSRELTNVLRGEATSSEATKNVQDWISSNLN